MQHWHLSSPQLEYYIERGRQERALALQKFLRATGAAVGRAVRRLGGVIAAIGRWWRRRAALAELRALDDRMLQDIGLSRAELPEVTARHAKSKRPLARTRAGIVATDEAAHARPAPAPVVPLPADRTAHALRTPLTSIKSFAEILRDNPDLPPARRDAFLDGVLDESARLERAIDQVVDDRRAA